MFEVSPEDLLRGLKRCKRLAKQDLLASSKTPNPRYWTLQAEARRATYDLLMTRIRSHGWVAAYEMARQQYVQLPLESRDADEEARVRGQEQALEMFFTMLGLDPADLQSLREQRQQLPQAGSSYAVNAH